MARPSKYNWEAIKEAYEGGLDIEDIVKKFKINKKQLNNKIHLFEWKIKGHIESDIKGFSDSLGTLAQNGTKHPEIADMIADKISTQLEDNEIIKGNRKLARAFQSLIGKGIREGLYKSAQDITAGVNSIKGIESIANPRPETIINNANSQQNNTSLSLNDFYGEV
jgi:hypothetical protein